MVDEKNFKTKRTNEKMLKTNRYQKKRKWCWIWFKISTEIVAALVVGVGIGLIVDKYSRN